MNNEFTMSLTSNLGVASEKIGVTTTVKQQVDNIQITIEHFKKCIQSQRKQQNQLDIQITKLQTNTQSQLKNLLNEIKISSKSICQIFNTENQKQNKQIQYLQLQKKILEDQHSKLNQLSTSLSSRIGEMQQSVGI